MPIYEFYCEKCGKVEEVIQKYDDPPPECTEDNVEMKRQISLTNTRRGAGIYSVDTASPTKWGDLE